MTDAPAPAAPVVPGARITSMDLWSVFFRSFFYQVLWNFRRMQNFGWLFSVWPALRRLYPDAESRSKLALEHLEYFNTHPYTASLIMGVVVGLEERHAAGEPIRRDQILAAKKFMSGPMAALGDTLFWATARPLFAVFSLSAGWVFSARSWWVAPALFLVLNNLLHIFVRGAGLVSGYRRKTEIVGFLARLNLQRVAQGAIYVGMGISLGGLLTLWLSFFGGKAVAGIFILSALAALRWGMSSTRLVYVAIAVSIAYGLVRPYF
ncbi:MAG: PTS mannose/fructose/sorbose transporter family subunit IID [Elusimicrobia bacterium]|nr:PTS mannose/fructose/sorbose transporter family subunit IID [Elusimicrobiota bacterium]